MSDKDLLSLSQIPRQEANIKQDPMAEALPETSAAEALPEMSAAKTKNPDFWKPIIPKVTEGSQTSESSRSQQHT